MRNIVLRYAAASALCALVASPALAGDWAHYPPHVIYAQPNTVIVVPPVGYVYDPSDARRQMYIVNQGPVYDGPGFSLARPTYSEGGYAHAYPNPYPYVPSYYSRGFDWYGAPTVRPYVQHYGWRHRHGYFGTRHRAYYGHHYRPYRGIRWSGRQLHRAPALSTRAFRYRHLYRSFERARPFATYHHYHHGIGGAYLYRPAPDARILHVPPRRPHASLRAESDMGPRLHRHPAYRYGVTPGPKPVWPRYRGRAPQRWTHLD